MTSVEAGGCVEVVLSVCTLVLPRNHERLVDHQGGRTDRSRCFARDDLNAGGLHVVQRGRHIAGL